jgi:hypothetical protein
MDLGASAVVARSRAQRLVGAVADRQRDGGRGVPAAGEAGLRSTSGGVSWIDHEVDVAIEEMKQGHELTAVASTVPSSGSCCGTIVARRRPSWSRAG